MVYFTGVLTNERTPDLILKYNITFNYILTKPQSIMFSTCGVNKYNLVFDCPGDGSDVMLEVQKNTRSESNKIKDLTHEEYKLMVMITFKREMTIHCT